MSRAAGLCPRCGGPKRGRSARASSPVAQCSRPECGDWVCDRHVTMVNGEWVCTKCSRKDNRKAS